MKEFCRQYHGYQKDKAGIDYVDGHLANVASQFNPRTPAWYVAWLHDILEDTSCTEKRLEDALQVDPHARDFYPEIVKAVRIITKKEGEDYQKYLEKVKQYQLARKVKIADLENNADITRIANPTKEDYERAEKYKKAITFLKE